MSRRVEDHPFSLFIRGDASWRIVMQGLSRRPSNHAKLAQLTQRRCSLYKVHRWLLNGCMHAKLSRREFIVGTSLPSIGIYSCPESRSARRWSVSFGAHTRQTGLLAERERKTHFKVSML